MIASTRIAVVGAGRVGSTAAYALLMSGLASEIVLVDANRAKAEGEAMDLNHAVPLTHPARVWAGDTDDCAGAAVTVITAGVAQHPGESRLALVERNAAVLRDIIPRVMRANPDGLLLVATNPVDVMAYYAWRLAGPPAGRVIGSGTILDTARFRYLLGQRYGVDPQSVHAYILGEHGDSEVPIWSRANVGGMPLPAFCAAQGLACTPEIMEEIARETREAAYRVIERKEATNYAIGAGLLRILQAILRDERSVLAVSTLIEDYHGIADVFLSLPTVVGREGVLRTLPLDLAASELERLRRSADVLRRSLAALPEGPSASAVSPR